MPEIRLAHADDLDLIVELESACLPDAWQKTTLQSVMKEARYLILIIENYGYLIGWSAAGAAEIERVGVLPAQRSHGVGARLVREAIGAFANRDASEIWLEVRAGNVAARALYRKCGFEESGVRRGYYDDGEDAIMMKRELRDVQASIGS